MKQVVPEEIEFKDVPYGTWFYYDDNFYQRDSLTTAISFTQFEIDMSEHMSAYVFVADVVFTVRMIER